MIFLLVEGTLIWSLVKLPRPPRRARAGADPRQHAARARLDDRRALILVVLDGRHVPLPRRHQEPARRRARTASAQGVEVASIDQPAPPERRRRSKIGVNGQQYLWRYDYPAASALQLLRDGRPDQHDGHAEDHLLGRASTPGGSRSSAARPTPCPATPTRPGSRSPSRAPTRASAPSCAARATPTCARACGRCRRTSTRPGRERQSADIKAAQRRRSPSSASGREAAEQRRPRSDDRVAMDSPRPATSPAPEVVMHGLPRSRTGWLAWLTTTDHKKIGIMYFVATFVFFILGGVEALMMRLQLGAAGQHADRRPRPTTASSRCTARR